MVYDTGESNKPLFELISPLCESFAFLNLPSQDDLDFIYFTASSKITDFAIMSTEFLIACEVMYSLAPPFTIVSESLGYFLIDISLPLGTPSWRQCYLGPFVLLIVSPSPLPR